MPIKATTMFQIISLKITKVINWKVSIKLQTEAGHKLSEICKTNKATEHVGKQYMYDHQVSNYSIERYISINRI